MPYQNHYNLADSVISHLDTVVSAIPDPFLQSKYVGFVAVTVVAVFELAIKDIFIEFSEKKHKVLGTYTRSQFERINGRIKIPIIRDEYCKNFGVKYSTSFKSKLDKAEVHYLRVQKKSIKNSYNNLLEWRHEFAHAGRIPTHVTYHEVTQSYTAGKEVIRCLAEAMIR